MIWTVGCLYTSPFLRVVYPSIWHRKGAQQDLVQSQSKVWYHHNHVQITKYNPMWGLHMDPKPHAALRRYLPIQVIFVAILSKYHYCPRFHLFHEFRRILDQELHNIFYDFAVMLSKFALLQALICDWHQIRSIRPPSTRPLMDLYRRTYRSSATKSTTSSPLHWSITGKQSM
jgi:hypothetical protein